MTPERIQEIIERAVAEGLAIQGGAHAAVTQDTEIYGPTSELDSLGFIHSYLTIEDALFAEGVTLHLEPDDTFDPAERYATVASMRDYIVGAIA